MPRNHQMLWPIVRTRRCGFTTIEIMIVMVIVAIASVLGMDYLAEYDAISRPKNAAIECVLAFRYARQIAMTSGTNTKVTFSTATNSFSVYQMSNGSTWDANPVPRPGGGLYTITMNSSPERNGVSISLNPSGTTALIYNTLGSLSNSSVITFRYGAKSVALAVPLVGDPVIN